MQSSFKVCKLYLVLCFGLSINATPILHGLKTTSSDYQQSESALSSNPSYGNTEFNSNLQPFLSVHQSLKNQPGAVTFRDENNNLVTQVKKESFNNENGQNSRTFEFQESKQLPNGYSKSFKKEYSSSSVKGTHIQKPVNTDSYYNNEKLINSESSAFGQNVQNYQVPSKTYGNTGYESIQSNLKSSAAQSMTNLPGVTTTFRDANGNIVTQVKKEVNNNDNGQNSRVVEFEETKQLPNGYSKSFKKEYSSSSVIGSHPSAIIQKPVNTGTYYNNEKLINSESSAFGQNIQNYQVPSKIYGNTDYESIKSNLKTPVDQYMTNLPGVTTTFRDANGNIVTQVKKEVNNNDNGQNSRFVEFEETKQLPNGYSKSFKKEYSSSSVIGSHPSAIIQKPVNTGTYYNNEKLINSESSAFGENVQNYQVPSKIYGNTDYESIKSNLKTPVDQYMTNLPGVTTTFRDANGNIVTQVKKEVNNNDNGQNSRFVEFEETKQLPNGYSKSFKKEYSSSSVIGSHPSAIIQKPVNTGTYYNNEKLINSESSAFGENVQNYQVPSKTYGNTGYESIQSNLKSSAAQSMTNLPGVTTTFRDANGNIVTQVKKEINNNDNGQNSRVVEFEETKQLPNGYSKSFKKEYSSSSVIGSHPSAIIQKPVNTGTYYNNEKLINSESSAFGENVQNYQVPSKTYGNTGYESIQSNLKSSAAQSMTNLPGVTTTFRDANGNIVTQVKKEVNNNDNGQNSRVVEFEETKQLPNGYSKSFRKEYSSSSGIGAYSTLIKDTTTERNAFIPQSIRNGESEKFNGYNTFFNDKKYSLDPNGPVNSQIVKNKYTTQTLEHNKANSFGYNTNGEPDCDESGVSSSKLVFNPQTGNIFQSPNQQSVNPITAKTPITQTFGNIQSLSTQKHHETGQQSVNLDDYYKPSYNGQSVDIDYSSQPKKPIGQQFENIESLSKQTQKLGQQSVDLQDFSKPSSTGQESVDIDFFSTPRTITQTFGKIQSLSTQKHQETGQQSVNLDDYYKPSYSGQSVDIDYSSQPKKPIGQQFENIESLSKQTQKLGQQSVDLQDFSKPSSTGQESVDFDFFSTPRTTTQTFGKIQSLSTQKHQETGQQSVNLDDFYKPSYSGQSVDIDYSSQPKKPIGQQFENIESLSTQTQKLGQQSVDLQDFSKPSPTGQESVNIDQFLQPQKSFGQKFESFSTQNHEEIGQQSVDLDDSSKPSHMGQESVDIDYNIHIPKMPIRQFEKIETSYQNKDKSVGQHPSAYSQFRESSSVHQNNNYGEPLGQQAVVFEGYRTLEKNISLSKSGHSPTYVDNYQTLPGEPIKSPVFQGQQTIDFTSISEEHKPDYKAQHYGNIDFKHSTFSSNGGKYSTGIDKPINPKFNNVFDKLGELEHEILEAKSTVNINKDNHQTTYSTDHNVKSMPVQTSKQVSHFPKPINDDKQYIEPESEMISKTNEQTFSSNSFVKESKTIVEQDDIENQTLNNGNFAEDTTTQSSMWKKIGDKFKGSIQNAKSKAQQLASTINESVRY